MRVPIVKILLLFPGAFLAPGTVSAQDLDWVTNAEIEYEIRWRSMHYIGTDSLELARFVIHIRNEKFKKLEASDTSGVLKVYRLLVNEKRDWAANLVLHDLFDRHAFFLMHSDPRDWKRIIKQDDIPMWTEFLREKGYLKPGDPIVEYVPPVCEDADRPADRRR